MVKKIIVSGINYYSLNMNKLIDKNKGEIIAFISDKPRNIGKCIDGIPIVSSGQLEKFNYDVMITTNLYNIGNIKGELLNFIEFLKTFFDFQVNRSFSELKNKQKNLDGFITGLSYAEVGLDANEFSDEVVNLAVSSQDLYYDYQIAQYICSQKEYVNRIKFAIIGLCYYSFEYDMSKSSLKDRVFQYYHFLKVIHNYNKSNTNYNKFCHLEKIVEDIFKEDYLYILYDLLKGFYDKKWTKIVNSNLTEEKIIIGIESAKKDSKKNYPLTVKENVLILNEYIKLLKENNIEPFIVICPTTKYYYNNLSLDMRSKFKECLSHIEDIEDIKILDYFKCDKFENDDFYDAAHLNRKGAQKFTKIISSEIYEYIDKL